MADGGDIESIPILITNGSGGGDHMRKVSATPTTHVIRGIRGRWQPKFNVVSEMMPAYWLPILLLFITLTVVMMSACLVMNHLNKGTDINAASAAAADEQVFLHYIFNDSDTVSIAQFAEFISYMAETYNNLKFKIFFLNNDIQSSYRLQFFSDLWAFIGLKSGFDISPDNTRAIQELKNNHSNVNILIKRLSHYVPDKCWKHKLRQIPQTNIPFFLRMYSVWRFGGIAIDLPTNNRIYRLRMQDQTVERAKQILAEYNNAAAGQREFGKASKSDLNFIDFLTKYLIEMTRMSFMPLIMSDEIKKPVGNDSVKENKTLSIHNSGIKKRSLETTANYPIMPKLNTGDVGVDLTSNATPESILESVNNEPAIKEQNDTKTIANGSKLIFALVRSGSYLLAPPNYDDDLMPTSQFRDDLYIDQTGNFVAADRPHHPFLANILLTSVTLPPQTAIKNVLTAKCGGKSKCSYCKTVFYF